MLSFRSPDKRSKLKFPSLSTPRREVFSPRNDLQLSGASERTMRSPFSRAGRHSKLSSSVKKILDNLSGSFKSSHAASSMHLVVDTRLRELGYDPLLFDSPAKLKMYLGQDEPAGDGHDLLCKYPRHQPSRDDDVTDDNSSTRALGFSSSLEKYRGIVDPTKHFDNESDSMPSDFDSLSASGSLTVENFSYVHATGSVESDKAVIYPKQYRRPMDDSEDGSNASSIDRTGWKRYDEVLDWIIETDFDKMEGVPDHKDDQVENLPENFPKKDVEKSLPTDHDDSC